METQQKSLLAHLKPWIKFVLELYLMEDLLLATSQMETQHPADDNQSSNQTRTSFKLAKFLTSGLQFSEEQILGFHGPRTNLGCIQRPLTRTALEKSD
jgi:hypothetical protein